jgi:tRNA(Ile)-lysidine synthase
VILSDFEESLARHGLARRGEKILLAVSGGADSLSLLHLFLEVRTRLGLRLAVAHFDHGLRGRSSKADASFVAAVARKHGLPFTLGGPSSGKAGREGMQQAAREDRLQFLLLAARRGKCERVALGHNLEDQAETMIMRFIGGGGPAGLGGIPPVSHGGKIIHPLLDISRREIEHYLRAKAVKWRRDPSNAKPVYLRNRLRLELLPLLAEDYNPRVVEHLGSLATLLRRDHDLLEELAGELLAGASRRRGEYFFPAALLGRAHPALSSRALLAALRSLAPRERSFGRRHLDDLLADRRSSRLLCRDLPGGITAFSDSAGLLLRRGAPLSPPLRGVPLSVPGSTTLPRSLGRISSWVRKRTADFNPLHLSGAPWSSVLDWEAVEPPLLVRRRRPGDRFLPLGLGGSSKVKDILVDRKVSRLLRDRLPLVCDRHRIIWVPGVTPCHPCRVTKKTKKLLFLRAGFEFPKPV